MRWPPVGICYQQCWVLPDAISSPREGSMQWDLTAQSDAAVIPSLFGRQQHVNGSLGTSTAAMPLSSAELEVPYYLNAHYWWAYIHPTAVQLFERQWLINLILWGNYGRLCDAVMAEMGDSLPGRTLQVACVYGDLTTRLSARVPDGGLMDVVDVLPIQLGNLRKKLPRSAPVRLLAMDSTNLNLPDASYDRALIFFLLHEQPSRYREQTLSELFRVVKPGGKIVVVDYDLPRWWHPLRYICGVTKSPSGFRAAAFASAKNRSSAASIRRW